MATINQPMTARVDMGRVYARAKEDVRLGMTSGGKPVIGIAPDVVEPKPGSVRVVCPLAYAEAVSRAGGWPVVLPPIVELIPEHLERCDGFVLTGGDDPRMEAFGAKTHPKATPVHPLRQAFDTALLRALMEDRETPTLGVCLGMQMMALVAGGSMEQHLPETLATADRHWGNAKHPVRFGEMSGMVTSHHRQAVRDAGSLRVAAVSEDGVVEAIERPDGLFFLGVQWHPERTEDPALGPGIFERFVRACAGRRSS
jgi:gamma-glutamyl-gamma-aminobutyrate hydrolase PuuD